MSTTICISMYITIRQGNTVSATIFSISIDFLYEKNIKTSPLKNANYICTSSLPFEFIQ